MLKFEGIEVDLCKTSRYKRRLDWNEQIKESWKFMIRIFKYQVDWNYLRICEYSRGQELA